MKWNDWTMFVINEMALRFYKVIVTYFVNSVEATSIGDEPLLHSKNEPSNCIV